MDSLALQSGIIIAVIAAGVIFANHAGGSDAVARRLFQIVLALALLFATVAGTTAFIRPPDSPGNTSSFLSDDDDESQQYIEDLNNRNSIASSIHLAVGIMATVIGVSAMARRRTLGLAIVAGGLLLVLFGGARGGGSGDAISVYATLLASALSTRSMGIDIAHFAVAFGGLTMLLAFGMSRYDHEAAADSLAIAGDDAG